MNRIIIIGVFFFLGISTLFAQSEENSMEKYHKNEFSVSFMGGIHALDYDLKKGKSTNPFSGGIGVGYTYFFKRDMGFSTGLDLAFYNTKVKLGDFSAGHQAFDHFTQKYFDFYYTLHNYEESQEAFYLNVPLLLHYQFDMQKEMKLYVTGGAKIGLPIHGKYKLNDIKLTSYGYYPHDNSTLTSPNFRGFGDFDIKSKSDELKYKVAFNLALELGMKWYLKRDVAFYIGAYFDYGLNNIQESVKEDLLLLQYNEMSPEDHIFNGVVKSSTTTNDRASTQLVSKVKPMAYGIKLRLAFGR